MITRSVVILLCVLSVSGQSIPRLSAWERIRNYPLHVQEAQGTLVGYSRLGHYMLVCGGFSRLPNVTSECYIRPLLAAASAEWTRVQDLPIPVTHMAQATDGNLFCGAGGYLGKHPGRSVTDVFCFHIRTRKWSTLPKLPAPRAGGGLAFWRKGKQRYLIFSGGVNRPFNSLKKHVDHGTTWVLNLRNKKQGWVDQKATMPDPRNHMAAVRTCGQYFWVGGQHKENEGSGNRRTNLRYLPWKKKWIYRAPIPVIGGLGHISASVMPFRCGFVIVGGTTAKRKKIDLVLYYSMKTNKWYTIGKYPRVVQTPVCGIKKGHIMCGTGGGPSWINNEFYRARIY